MGWILPRDISPQRPPGPAAHPRRAILFKQADLSKLSPILKYYLCCSPYPPLQIPPQNAPDPHPGDADPRSRRVARGGDLPRGRPGGVPKQSQAGVQQAHPDPGCKEMQLPSGHQFPGKSHLSGTQKLAGLRSLPCAFCFIFVYFALFLCILLCLALCFSACNYIEACSSLL